jgi:hypothetical protein
VTGTVFAPVSKRRWRLCDCFSEALAVETPEKCLSFCYLTWSFCRAHAGRGRLAAAFVRFHSAAGGFSISRGGFSPSGVVRRAAVRPFATANDGCTRAIERRTQRRENVNADSLGKGLDSRKGEVRRSRLVRLSARGSRRIAVEPSKKIQLV